MRVLVVPKWYPWPDRPVFGNFCREQARAIAHAHEVVVLASDAVRRPGFLVYELSDGHEEGLRTLRLRYCRPWFRPAAMLCQLIGMVAALRRLRREGWKPQIVHAHVYSAGLPAVVLGRVARAGVVISEHYTGFQRGLITGYDLLTARVAFRSADLVAPVSHDLAQHVRSLAPGTRVRVVENPVDTAVFHPAAPPRQQPGSATRLLTVAALTEKKGHLDLLHALADLRRDGHDLALDLVGDGELRSALQQRVGELGLDGAVRFHGERSKAQVAEAMRAAQLFVLPSRFENLPVVLIEAMASGLPAVATAVGGVPELADTARDGLVLCPPARSSELARAIIGGLERASSVDRTALAKRAGERFGYEAIERVWSMIYDDLRPARERAGTISG